MVLPTVSVVIPTFNRRDALGKALSSVLKQSYENFEIVIVDDGSTDGTSFLLEAHTDSRIRLFSIPNGGASAARNFGVRQARGRYIAFLDSDDRFLPNHLEASINIALKHPNDAVYGQVIADRGNGRLFIKPYRAICDGETMSHYLMRDRGFVQTSSLFIPKALALKVPYREDVAFGDDTDFAIRLSLTGSKFRMTDFPSVIWSDDRGIDRLSNVRDNVRPISWSWLEDLKPHISSKDYLAYSGWHVAKRAFRSNRMAAFKLFFKALLRGAYSIKMAIIVFIQLTLSDHSFRCLANVLIGSLVVRNRKLAPFD